MKHKSQLLAIFNTLILCGASFAICAAMIGCRGANPAFLAIHIHGPVTIEKNANDNASNP